MTDTADRQTFLDAMPDVSRETLDRLDIIMATLDEWRMKSNLIGPREWPRVWSRHVVDSFQVLDHIDETANVIDLGSGAGFPGLMIAAARPGGHVTMVESVGKKCAFLRAAIEAAGLPATVRQERVEAIDMFHVKHVTARAFAPLPKLLEYSAPWLEAGAVGLFHKGARWYEELTEAQEKWSFAYEAIPSRSGGSGVILKLWELERVSVKTENIRRRKPKRRRG